MVDEHRKASNYKKLSTIEIIFFFWIWEYQVAYTRTMVCSFEY